VNSQRLFISCVLVSLLGACGSGGTGGETGGGGGAGTGAGGSGGSGTGAAGTGVAGTGAAGTGGSGTGAAGTGVAGTGAAGTGVAGTGAAGTGATGLGPGTCQAITASSSDCTDASLPPRLYLCISGLLPAPDPTCVHPPASAANADIKYCCTEAICTRQMNIDYLCMSKAGTPSAVHCAEGAVEPAGCVPSGSSTVNRCCP
jgi:hypothetical protein